MRSLTDFGILPIATVIQRILERLGCHFELAKDGKEAIEVVSQRWPFDVVLMDIEMPVMNGWEATERIRFDFPEPVRSVPIVALTSHTTIDDARRCLEEVGAPLVFHLWRILGPQHCIVVVVVALVYIHFGHFCGHGTGSLRVARRFPLGCSVTVDVA